jgi:hypothetical protein
MHSIVMIRPTQNLARRLPAGWRLATYRKGRNMAVSLPPVPAASGVPRDARRGACAVHHRGARGGSRDGLVHREASSASGGNPFIRLTLEADSVSGMRPFPPRLAGPGLRAAVTAVLVSRCEAEETT